MPNQQRPDGPVISADVVPLLVGGDGPIRVLLSKRRFQPHRGQLALPGVLILAGETVAEACLRALDTKAGVDARSVRLLRMGWLSDSPVRDRRGHTISVSYIAVIDDEGAPARKGNESFAIADLPDDLPFDHTAIIERCLAQARDRLWDDAGELARALLGDRFTTPQAVSLLTDLDPSFNTTNTNRLLAKQGCLERAAEPTASGRGRPPSTWTFASASPD